MAPALADTIVTRLDDRVRRFKSRETGIQTNAPNEVNQGRDRVVGLGLSLCIGGGSNET